MTQTQWCIADGNEIELDGHKFGTGDEGAPLLCNVYCSGRSRASPLMKDGEAYATISTLTWTTVIIPMPVWAPRTSSM